MSDSLFPPAASLRFLNLLFLTALALELEKLVAQLGGLLEIQRFGGGKHLILHRLHQGLQFFFAHGLRRASLHVIGDAQQRLYGALDALGRNAVQFVVGLLQSPAAVGLVHGLFHALGENVAVEDD